MPLILNLGTIIFSLRNNLHQGQLYARLKYGLEPSSSIRAMEQNTKQTLK